MKKRIVFFIKGFFYFVGSIFLMTCKDNVGLGTAVDVSDPIVEILYPPSDSVIRDSFVFAGTCTDDRGIEKLLFPFIKIMN